MVTSDSDKLVPVIRKHYYCIYIRIYRSVTNLNARMFALDFHYYSMHCTFLVIHSEMSLIAMLCSLNSEFYRVIAKCLSYLKYLHIASNLMLCMHVHVCRCNILHNVACLHAHSYKCSS